jgi:zinc D-Ala-D-Ala dipeptidase
LNIRIIITLFALVLVCLTNCKTEEPSSGITKDSLIIDLVHVEVDTIVLIDSICALEEHLIREGMVNIQKLDSTILVELKYSTEDNFMHKDMYGCLENCYLQPDVAERLLLCQAYLKKKDSTLTLLLYDGVRPRSVQQYMWDILDMPIHEKTQFVSNPIKGSLHNFGAAIDITLANAETQVALDMGAKYDQIGIISWPIKEKIMLDSGLLTINQVDNRKLLRRSMRAGKFFNIQTEWWHFNACNRHSAYTKYKIIEGLPSNDSINLEN